MKTISPALLPWKRYIDRLPEPDRSVFIHEFQMCLLGTDVPTIEIIRPR